MVALGLSSKAATPAAGFALQNATPTIISWTAPNDGKNHSAVVTLMLDVSSLMTGGEIASEVTAFAGARTFAGQISQAGLAAGLYAGNGNNATAAQNLIVPPGGTVSVVQFTALTGGAANAYAEILGS